MNVVYNYIKYLVRLLGNSTIIYNYGVAIDVKNLGQEDKTLLLKNGWEVDEAEIILNFVKKTDVVLEVGACIGFISNLVAKIVDSENLVVVEANPEAIPLLQRNMFLNGNEFRIINGLVTKGSKGKIYISKSKLSSKTNMKNYDKCYDVERLDIEELLAETKANFLVMDIEGEEYDVLNGLNCEHLDKILVEFHGIKNNHDSYINIIRNIEVSGLILEKRGQNDDRVHYFSRK